MSHEHEHDPLCPSTAKVALPAVMCLYCEVIGKTVARTRAELENYRP